MSSHLSCFVKKISPKSFRNEKNSEIARNQVAEDSAKTPSKANSLGSAGLGDASAWCNQHGRSPPGRSTYGWSLVGTQPSIESLKTHRSKKTALWCTWDFLFRHWLSPSKWKEIKMFACPSIRSTASASLRTRTVLSMQSTAWHGPWSCVKNEANFKFQGNMKENPSHLLWFVVHCTICSIQTHCCSRLESMRKSLHLLFNGWPHTCPNLHTTRRVVHGNFKRPNAAAFCGCVWTQARMHLKWIQVAEMIWDELDVEHTRFMVKVCLNYWQSRDFVEHHVLI